MRLAFGFIMMFCLLGEFSWAQYKSTIIMADTGSFYLLVMGPEGVKKQYGQGNNWDGVLEHALESAKKLESSLNAGEISWSQVTRGLLKMITVKPEERTNWNDDTKKDYENYKKVRLEPLKKYSVTLLPGDTVSLYLGVVGPDGVMKAIGDLQPGEYMGTYLEHARKLEAALNNGSLKWTDLDTTFLRSLVKLPMDTSHAEKLYNNSKYSRLQSQKLSGYRVELAPTRINFHVYFSVMGPEGFVHKLAYLQIRDNVDNAIRSFQNAERLRIALEKGVVTWDQLTHGLVERLAELPPTNGYVDPSTIEAYDKIQRISPVLGIVGQCAIYLAL